MIYNNNFIRFFVRVNIPDTPATPFLENLSAQSNFYIGVRESYNTDHSITISNGVDFFDVGFVNGFINNFLDTSIYSELFDVGEVFIESIYNQVTGLSFTLEDFPNSPDIFFANYPYFDLSDTKFISGFSVSLTNDFTIIINQQSSGDLHLFGNNDDSFSVSIVDDRINLIATGFDILTATIPNRQGFSDIIISRTGDQISFYNNDVILGVFDFNLVSFDINIIGDSVSDTFYFTELFIFDSALSQVDVDNFQDNSLSSNISQFVELDFTQQNINTIFPELDSLELEFVQHNRNSLFSLDLLVLEFVQQRIESL